MRLGDIFAIDKEDNRVVDIRGEDEEARGETLDGDENEDAGKEISPLRPKQFIEKQLVVIS